MPTKLWVTRITEYLLALGYKEKPSSSRKYRMFQKEGSERTWFLGSSGAARVSLHGTVATAFSVTAHIHKTVSLWEMNKEEEK